MRETLLKLTKHDDETILIGVESIIHVEKVTDKESKMCGFTEIESRHAMVTRVFVKETPEEIYEQYQNKK